MIVPILFLLPSLLYVAAALALWRGVRAPVALQAGGSGRAPAPAGVLRLMPLALALHAMSLAWPWETGGFHFGFAKAISAMLWIGLLLLWLQSRRLPVDALRMLILPMAAIGVLLPWAFPGTDLGHPADRPLFVPHLIAGTLAYGVLMLGALNALLMLGVQRDLHRPLESGASAWSRWLGQLPPLLALEKVLFQFIGTGFILLLITTLSGMVFSEQVFGRPFRVEHKTVFSLLSLGFFGVLLLGRLTRGWRGRIAMRFTLWGFLILLLAYVGSRFVLEVVLQRA
jgi:ABC-type uncharacterized transport system permease subunit